MHEARQGTQKYEIFLGSVQKCGLVLYKCTLSVQGVSILIRGKEASEYLGKFHSRAKGTKIPRKVRFRQDSDAPWVKDTQLPDSKLYFL